MPKTTPHCPTCACVGRQLSDASLALLTAYEGGIVNHVYLDSGGEPTIGVGHLLTTSERRSGKILINGVAVKYRNGLTDKQATDLLHQDVAKYVKTVNDYVTVPLTSYQFGALVSFCFNVGRAAFKESTLLKRLNAGRFSDVPAQLKRWKYDNGKVVKGLINRRKKEIKQWKMS